MDSILSFFQQGFSAIVPFVILLGLLIFVHELGHFLVAKYYGVRVETFSLGFGKKIIQYKKGDTVYALSLIPLGGYVKMFGDEAGADIDSEQKKYSFLHKPVGQRIAVVLAGPLMNLFFAIFLFMFVAFLGEDSKAPVLGDIAPETQAWQQGFRSGDKIVSIDESEISTWPQVQKILANSVGNKLVVGVQREDSGTLERLEVNPVLLPNDSPLSLDSMVGSIEGISTNSKAPAVAVISEESVAGKAGLKTGDFVEEINGATIKHWRQLEKALRSSSGAVLLKVARNSEGSKEPTRHTIKINLPDDRITALENIGIEIPDLYLSQVIAKSPAEKAGFKAGDRVVKINEKVIGRWEELLGTVKGYNEAEGPLRFEVRRGNEVMNLVVSPEVTHAMNSHGLQENRYTVGIVPSLAQFGGEFVTIKVTDPLNALKRGINRTYEITHLTLVSFVKLFKAEISARNIGGVISIGQAASETFKVGMSQFITMMGIISVNLFILNLLPIPVLDGGHLVFYVVEAIKGSPLSLKKMELAQRFGFVMLMSLMVFALFNDFNRILSNW